MTPVDTKRPTETQRVYNQSLERDFLKKLYEVMEPGKEIMTSQHMMAELTGVPTNVVQSVMRVMRDEKIYTVRSEYDPKGRRSYWTIDKPFEEAYHALKSDQARRNGRVAARNQAISRGRRANTETQKTNEKPAPIATNGDAVAQAKIWAKSAKAYMSQVDEVMAMIEKLQSLGIEVDQEGIYAATKLRHDEKLANIALVIPYIDHLEKSLRNLQAQFQTGKVK